MDAEVQETADQPATQDDRQHGWRSWFGKGSTGTDTDTDTDTAESVDSDDDDSGLPPGELIGAQNAGSVDDDAESGSESGAAGDGPDLIDPMARRPLRARAKDVSFPLVARPLINPRLAADPRLKIWIIRTLISIAIYVAVTMWQNWRFGLTAAIIYACADTIYRSKTTGITPTSVRVTAAQRSTRRRLKVLQAAGYMALHARIIPGEDGEDSVIDHVVIGPSGVYTVDSQKMDRRLPVRAIGGMLFHGPVPQDEKIDHARFEAQKASELITTEFGQRIRVRPAMVLYGPKVPWVIMALKGVDVFDGGHTGAYFRRRSKATAGHHLDPGQVALVFAAAAHALPPLSP